MTAVTNNLELNGAPYLLRSVPADTDWRAPVIPLRRVRQQTLEEFLRERGDYSDQILEVDAPALDFETPRDLGNMALRFEADNHRRDANRAAGGFLVRHGLEWHGRGNGGENTPTVETYVNDFSNNTAPDTRL